LTSITAWETLFERFRLTPASTGALLVVGGAGGVGSILIQLAIETPARRVAALVDEQRIRTTLTRAIADFSAAGLRQAHELVESGRMTGKVVVHR
jgi:NADPH:quinone reductase-like Zn-dependent oxidoreductase